MKKDVNMIDTSWYVESRMDREVRDAIATIGGRTMLKSCEVIDEIEMRRALAYLRKNGLGQEGEKMIEFYKSVIGGAVPSFVLPGHVERWGASPTRGCVHSSTTAEYFYAGKEAITPRARASRTLTIVRRISV